MAIQIDTILNGRYRILEVIAKGGMGAVYRAQDETLGVSVALKENLIFSEEASRQFHREATLLAALRHPNLPRVTDHFIIPDQGQYLVMDYIEGEDLRTRAKRAGSFSTTDAVLIGAEVCSALAFLHSRKPPVVHRDIKQGNIKINPNGQVFLVDFGLAKIAEQGTETTTGARALTPGYASPEHYGSGTDARSDIYSLGATLYSVLANRLPEDGLARKLDTATLSPIREFNPKVSEELQRVIEKSMEIDPAKRYQSATDFRNALINTAPEARQILKDHQESQQSSGQPTLFNHQSARSTALPAADIKSAPNQNKRFPVLIVLILFFVVAAGLGIAFTPGILSGLSKNIPVQSNNIATLPPADVAAAATIPPAPSATIPPPATQTVISITATIPPQPTATAAATPVGGGAGDLVFVSDRSGMPQLYRMNLNNNEVTQIFENPDGACQPSWSPDGTRLVFVSPCRSRQDTYPGSGLFIINLDGTGMLPLISVPGGDFEPSWSPDGGRIAFSTLRDRILHVYVYDLATNTSKRISSQSSFDRQAAWSPDGLSLAFQSTRLGVAQIWTASAEGDSPKEFSYLNSGSSSWPTWSPTGDVIVFSQGSQPVLTAKQVGVANAPEVDISNMWPSVNAEFSPDGYWLVFQSTQDGNLDIYRMTRNGANLTRLTDDPAQDFDPAWQPKQP
jgi:serine/threonine protein kinase